MIVISKCVVQSTNAICNVIRNFSNPSMKTLVVTICDHYSIWVFTIFLSQLMAADTLLVAADKIHCNEPLDKR